MSKRKRDKARIQRRIQGTNINILLGRPRNLYRTPEGSTSCFKGDEEEIRKTWKPIAHNYSMAGSTGTLYAPRKVRSTMVIRRDGSEHLLVVDVEHGDGHLSMKFKAANYSACARKAWSALREMQLDKDDQTEVDRGEHKTRWTLKTKATVERAA